MPCRRCNSSATGAARPYAARPYAARPYAARPYAARPYAARPSAARSTQAGAALVVALLIFALCTALIVAMQGEFMLFYQRGANVFQGEQSYAYLRGAEELASLALVLDHDEDQKKEQPRDDLTEIWAQEATPYALDEGGWLVGRLQDLQGRFNLNSLLQPPESESAGEGGDRNPGQGVASRFSPAQQQFIRLLQTLEEPIVGQQEAIQITESVMDWLDADGSVRPTGAEDDYYYGRTPAHRAANRAMSSVSELRAVANVSQEIYCALLPLVTVWPRSPQPMNVHTMPPALLRTLNADDDLSPLSEGDGESLDAQRTDPGFADLSEFLGHPVLEGKELSGVSGLLGETSSYFQLNATVEVAARSTHLYSVLERNKRSIRALVRNSGTADPACLRRAPDTDGSNEERDES